MGSMAYSPLKIQLYNLHKSFGMTVLLLGVMRIVWKNITATPESLSHYKNWEKTLSKTIHIVLYVAIILMPLSGWVMSSAGGFPVRFFGLFDVPNIVPKDEFIFDTAHEVHEIIGFIIAGCVGLHIVGALKHHFVDRDTTLRRMGANPVVAILGLLTLGAALMIPLQHFIGGFGVKEVRLDESVRDSVQLGGDSADKVVGSFDWIIDSAGSEIAFSYMQYGSRIEGVFDHFDADIYFDPDDLGNNHARVDINAMSIATGSDDRDDQARGDQWFDAAKYPDIVFEAKRFEDVDAAGGEYTTYGQLTIREKTLPVEFPFQLLMEDDGKTALMSAELSLNRLDFDIGQGAWQTTEAIENEVKIMLKMKAERE